VNNLKASTSVASVAEVMALYRTDFRSFIRKAWSILFPGQVLDENWHLDAIAYHIELVGRGDLRRLMINVPPRSLKSLICSVFWPAFFLGNHPDKWILVVSHSMDLAIDLSNKCRKLIAHPEFQRIFPALQTQLAKDSEREINTVQGGGRIAISVDSGVTGRGADFVVVDDLIDASNADNENVCGAVNKWFDTTLSTRLNEPAKTPIVLVMQRLSIFDPITHLAVQEEWTKLSFPAIATKNEIIRVSEGLTHERKEGDLLHPSRYPIDYLESQKKKMGKRAFEAQFQQNPLPDGGGIVDISKFGRYNKRPKFYDAKFLSIDAASGSDSGSYSVVLGCRISNGRLFITNVFRQRTTLPELLRYVVKAIEGHDINHVVVEKASNGIPLLQILAEKYIHTKMQDQFPHFLQPVTANNGKPMRMEKAMVEIEKGLVFLPNEAPWLDPLEHELRAFPSGQFNDQVDALSQAIHFFHWFMTDPAARITRGLPPH
tara:strand:- start:771 stop:2234 length:1464 start_codon:yes stop_codon:yes gene_type:complete